MSLLCKKKSMHIKGQALYTEVIKNISPSGKKVIFNSVHFLVI